ncbi:MAG TPA: hypothetical protein VIO95_08450 [Mycobacterium sp.]
MSHKTIRRGVMAGLGAAAAALGAGGLAATASADDIDMYGFTDTTVFTQFTGTTGANIFTTTFNDYITVDETTGVVTPHFTFPTTVETMQALMPGVTNEGGFNLNSVATEFFGDTTTTYTATATDTDFFLANGNDLTTFLPLLITSLFSPGIPDADLFPF